MIFKFANLTHESHISGVGAMGNVHIICNTAYNHKDCNIYVDGKSCPPSIFEDPEYMADHNITNPWECFFTNKNTKGGEVLDLTTENQGYTHMDYKYAKVTHHHESVNTLRNLFFKNFGIQPYILDEVNKFYKENLTPNTLGIHWRKTDMKNAETSTYESLIDKVSEITQNKTIDTIFIASEDHKAIEVLKQNFNINIVFTDCSRTTDSVKLDTPFDRYDGKRKYHVYLTTKEVLIDTLLLSKCKYFIRAHISAVSDCALVLDRDKNIKQTFFLETIV
jgi:hypothetical protein